MTAASARAQNVGAAPSSAPTDLAVQIDELTARIDSLVASKSTTESRKSALNAERRSLLVPARVDRDAAAQKRLREVDENLSALERELADDQAALDDLSGRLDGAKKAQITAVWEARRTEVRNLLSARRDSELAATILRLAKELNNAIETASEQDKECERGFARLGARAGAYPRLSSAHRRLAQFAAREIMDVMEIPAFVAQPQYLRDRDAVAEDRAVYERAIKELDDLELIG